MNRKVTSYLLLLFIGCCWQSVAMAQSGFVHIQSENGQPFYVEWNGTTYGSSSMGYVIIPKIAVGEQTMVIGFPKSQYPEFIFILQVTERPRGFSLKLAVDNSWSLFDMVNFSLIRGKRVTVAEKTALQQEAERFALANKPFDSLENVFKPVQAKAPAGISKIFHKTTLEGTDLVYVVNNDGKTDTVVIFIPSGAEPPKTPATGNNKYLEADKTATVRLAIEDRMLLMIRRRAIRPLLSN